MARDAERLSRSSENPLVGGLPDAPGILVAMRLSPGLATHLRGLADALLVDDFPGATLSRSERELLATAVSASNDCFYCMDSHGAFASELMARGGAADIATIVDGVKCGTSAGTSAKMQALLKITRMVAKAPRELTSAEVAAATSAGASDGDVQLAVLIAGGFAMYNRMVDGLRARTPPSAEAYRERAKQIAEHGYSDPRLTAIPK